MKPFYLMFSLCFLVSGIGWLSSIPNNLDNIPFILSLIGKFVAAAFLGKKALQTKQRLPLIYEILSWIFIVIILIIAAIFLPSAIHLFFGVWQFYFSKELLSSCNCLATLASRTSSPTLITIPPLISKSILFLITTSFAEYLLLT